MREHALRRLRHHAGLYLRVRLELLELDLDAERQRLGGMLVAAALLALAAMMALQFIAVLVIAAAWYTPWRLHVIAALLLLALIATLAAGWRLSRLRGEPARPIGNALRDLDRFFQPLAPPPEQQP